MNSLERDSARIAAIYNAAYLVRHYQRPGQRAQLAAAVRMLGLACRVAFNESENFAPVLAAIFDALSTSAAERGRPHLD